MSTANADELMHLYGIGPVGAKELLERLVIIGAVVADKKYTYGELRAILRRKEIFSALPKATQADLTYAPLKEIPRGLIEIFEHEMKKYATGIKFDIAGSYRRGKHVSHDVDVVLEQGALDGVIKLINAKSHRVHIYAPFASGDQKAGIIIAVKDKKNIYHIKIDVFLTLPKEYIFALLFATGSGKFNVRMRAVAKHKGFLLNHRGLYRRETMTRVPMKNEKAIFKALGITYLPPEKRNA